MAYEPTGNENVIREITTAEVDLAVLVGMYVELRARFLALPVIKTVPDQETLVYFNKMAQIEREFQLGEVVDDARRLYQKLLPVVQAGLLPAKWMDKFEQLEDFVNDHADN